MANNNQPSHLHSRTTFLSSRLDNRAVALSASLDIVRVHTRRRAGGIAALVGLLAAVKVDVLQVKGVQMAGDVSEKRQANVDKEVCRDDETVSKSVAKQSTVKKKNGCTYPCRILQRPRRPEAGLLFHVSKVIAHVKLAQAAAYRAG